MKENVMPRFGKSDEYSRLIYAYSEDELHEIVWGLVAEEGFEKIESRHIGYLILQFTNGVDTVGLIPAYAYLNPYYKQEEET